jgi:PAS domain S-box-containing protein
LQKEPDPQHAWFSSWPWAVVFLAALLTLAAANYYLLVPLKRSTIEGEAAELEHVARTMGSSVSSVLRHVEGVLEEVDENYKRDTFGFKLREYLQVEGSSIEAINAITVRDDRGRVISSSTRQPNAIRDGAPAYFAKLRRELAAGGVDNTQHRQIYFSRPVRSFADGSWQLWMSVAQVDDTNEPLTIISASLDLRFIVDTLMPEAVGRKDANALISRDFVLLARNPWVDSRVGKSVEAYPLYRTLAESGAASAAIEYGGPLASKERLGAARWIFGRSFIVSVSRSMDALLAAWRRSVLISGMGSLAVLLLIGTMWRVTTRKAARERSIHQALSDSERRFRLLINGVTDYAIFMLDPKGIVANWNHGARRIMGYQADEIVGKPVSVFFPESKSGTPQAEIPLDHAKEWGRYESEGWLLRKTGDRFWANTVIQRIKGDDDELLGFALIARDTTERNKLLNELRSAKTKAERAAAAKSEFLANMSHEIRTPLTGVMGYSRLALEYGHMSNTVRSYVERAFEAGSALRVIIDDILDFSKLESGELRLESVPFSVRGYMEGCLSIVRLMAEEKGLELKLEIDENVPEWLAGDQARLRQVLLNLLNNAIKFTPNGHVELKLDCLSKGDQDATLRVAVIDTGIGIPEEDQEKLFLRFSQADSSIARKFGGTGLGLAISKRIIEALGGEISLESKRGLGSTFWFTVTLPLAEAPEETSSTPDAPLARGLHVLMVDDLEMNRDLVKLLLEHAGHTVSVARDGAEAVTMAKANRYDMVLMDIQMPGMDGFEATRQIRALDGGRGNVPIVALTADTMPNKVAAFRNAGLSDHFPKPIDSDALVAFMARWAQKLESGKQESATGRQRAAEQRPAQQSAAE